MCKLFAWQGDGNRNVEKLIKGLLVAEIFKNPHGTGIFVVSKSGKKKLLKRGYDAVSLLIREAENLNYTLYDAKFIMGHVRYATHGSPKKRNSHPFVFTRVVGCHNGVLDYDKLVFLAKKEGLKKIDEVDSKLFFRILNHCLKKYSLEESLRRILKKVNGDYTFLIYHKNELYFIRNDGRPLSFFDMRDAKMGVFLASTKKMFEIACSFAGIKKQPEIMEVKPHILYKLDRKGNVIEVTKIKVKEKKKVKQTIFSSYTYPFYTSSYNDSRYYRHYYKDDFDTTDIIDDFENYDWHNETYGITYDDDYLTLEEKIDFLNQEIRDLEDYLLYLEDRIYRGETDLYGEYQETISELEKKKKELRELERQWEDEYLRKVAQEKEKEQKLLLKASG
jgi:glucosamine 6-phosphate synthetase-like amidotransferase/phosphosugar isomerase protein